MKKLILSLAVIMVTVFYTNAQSFTLELDGEPIGDTLIIAPDTAGINYLDFELLVTNNTGNGVNIKVARNQISVVENSVNYFCWGACYPSEVDSSGMYIFLAAGATSNPGEFSAHYEVNGTVGVTVLEYTFYNMDQPEENVKFVLLFDSSPSAINENLLNKIHLSNLYPNPATNFVDINYDLPYEIETASVKIVNILGSVVKEQQINKGMGKLRMDISDINDGIYFYSTFVNGEAIKTQKLIIK